MLNLQILVLITLINTCVSQSDDLTKKKPTPTPFQDWDYLVYSQRWPITSCMEWEEQNGKNVCNLPKNVSAWNVHGVWPNKIGAEGPFYCDSALHFDPDQLEPILSDLEEHWTNIEGNTKLYSFWKHEWSKHGTCASSLPQLNSVYNYFKQGLDWNSDYKLGEMLAVNNIVPNVNGGYDIGNIYKTIQAALGKNPIVECVVDGKRNMSLISEIRICFNKSLEVIDCNVGGVALGNGILSNCKLKEPVMYFANVPPNYEHDFLYNDIQQYTITLSKLYQFIKFLIWFTL